MVIIVAILQVFECPFTRVEETFNTHVIHDMLTKGVSDGVIGDVRTRLAIEGES